MDDEDFEDDSKDAGEIGAGQNVTALYEIRPNGSSNLKEGSAFTIHFRYKAPDSESSVPLELPIFDEGHEFGQASDAMVFSAGVAAYAMLLKQSVYKGTANYTDILQWLEQSSSYDPHNFKAEFKKIVEKAETL